MLGLFKASFTNPAVSIAIFLHLKDDLFGIGSFQIEDNVLVIINKPGVTNLKELSFTRNLL